MDTSILRSGPASVNTIGDNMDCNLSSAATNQVEANDKQETTIVIDNQTSPPAPEVSENTLEIEGQLPSMQSPAVAFIFDQRRRKRREGEIKAALDGAPVLSQRAQDKLLQELLAGGWGRLAHCITRHFKAPGRYGHKMVDIALITTVYDRTIACVTPVMFAAISMPDFEDETGMNEANLRKALTHLQLKGVLLKIKISPRVIFWALNPHFFKIREQCKPTQVKSPQGKLPRGNPPCSEDGNLPCVNTGQTNPVQSPQTSGNQKEISDPKNPLKESKKESLLSSSEFPEDMLQRWSTFEAQGQESKVKKEREIFQRLFLRHQETFFRLCGRVVKFLEQHGTVKAGKEIQIHSPMSWLEDHWESNLALYLNWEAQKVALEEAHAKRLEREAIAAAELAEKQRREELARREEARWKEEQDAAALRFLSLYTQDGEVEAFSSEAVRQFGCIFTLDAWEKLGWEHPIVRTCVLNHFMAVERGNAITNIQPQTEEVSV
ncbi:MAG: hypothetical protein HYX41_07930 [Bdellovibrio sp.]|nr:hypothetical protein [Bdellovibrio sp.]